MLQSLFSGASGLRAHQTQMDVIGNNIANINTVGFKASQAEFKQALSDTLHGGVPGSSTAGGSDPAQVGMGVTVGGVSSLQTQGSMQNTGRPLDVAIEGNGFLALSNGSGQFYTRDGSLTADSDGNLVSNGNVGFRVMGWNADPTTGQIDPAGALSAIRLPLGQTSVARQTGNVTYAGNLDSDPTSTAPVTTSFKIFDAQGQPHNLQVVFTKDAGDPAATPPVPPVPGQWSWKATSLDGDFTVPVVAGDPIAAPPVLPSSDSGTVTFDANGKITSGGSGDLTLAITASGSSQKMKLDFGALTSLSGGGQSTANLSSQDGLPPGTLTGYSIEPNGVINGTFSNGMTSAIAQIAIAGFSNPSGLAKAGGNVFVSSANAGVPQIGTPASGGRGKLSAGNLEMSNVDLSVEFTDMIVAQRGFQANSKIITVSDELLQDLISLKR